MPDGTKKTRSLQPQKITTRMRVEQPQSESERHYRLLFETMLQGVVYQDANEKFVAMNPAAERILGRSPSEFLGQTSLDQVYQTLREDGSPFSGREHPARIAFQTGREVHDVVMGVFNPLEKAYRWIMINAVPLFREGEVRPYRVYMLFSDITARIRAEEVQRANEEKMRTVYDQAAVGINQISIEGGYLYVNQKFCTLTGYSKDELLHLSTRDLYHPVDQARDEIRMRQLLTGEISTYTDEMRCICKNGKVLWVNLTVSLVRNDNEPVYFVKFVEDFSDRKLMEEALQANQEKLFSANDELQAQWKNLSLSIENYKLSRRN